MPILLPTSPNSSGSSVPEDRLHQWVIQNERIQFDEVNTRPWGSYELVFSMDGSNWLHTGRVWGSAWTYERAFAFTLCEWIRKDGDLPPPIKQHVGSDISDEIKQVADIN